MQRAAEIRARLEHELDLILGAGSCGIEPSTVVDLTRDAPVMPRRGKDAERLIRLAS